jgi:hypothetical protein
VSAGLSVSDAARKSLLQRQSTDLGLMPMYFRLIDPQGVAHWRGKKGWSLAATRQMVAPSLWLLDRSSKWHARRTEVLPVDHFDDRVDDIWKMASGFYPVISCRDKAWACWRFDQAPGRGEYLRYYLLHRQAVLGYIVLRSTTWNDTPALEVIDYLAKPDDLAPLFAHTIEIARAFRVTALHCNTLNRRLSKTFRSLGFFARRNQGIRFLLYTREEDPIGADVRDRTNWFLTSADSDLDC